VAQRKLESLSLMLLEAVRLTKTGPVILGSGLSLVAGALLRKLKPSIEIILDSGAISPADNEPIESVSDWRILRANSFCSMRDVLGPLMAKGGIKTGIIGCVEIDGSGGLNSTRLVRPDGQVHRFPGAGGAPAIAWGVQNLIVVAPYDTRRIVKFCQYVSTRIPGSNRELGREESESHSYVVTEKCVMRLQNCGDGMLLVKTMPGVLLDDLVADFPSLTIPNRVITMQPASKVEIEALAQVKQMQWRF
jgi:acyl CoA:acetate/3-ketoacid CoA transferase beta subunit